MFRFEKGLVIVLFVVLKFSQTQSQAVLCQNVVESALDAPVTQVYPVTSEIIFIQTQQQTLFRTDDGGKSWIDQYHFLPPPSTIFSVLMSTGRQGVSSVYIHPNRQWIYVIGWSGHFWISKDEGRTFVAQMQPFEFSELFPHPTNPDLLLSIRWSRWCWEDAGPAFLPNSTHLGCVKELILSQDSGNQWNLVATDVRSVAWEGKDTTTAYFLFYPTYNHSVLAVTKDLFISNSHLLSNVISFRVASPGFLLVTHTSGSQMGLFVSSINSNSEKIHKFKELHFYSKMSPNSIQRSFQFLEDNIGSTFVGVVYDNQDRLQVFLVDSNFTTAKLSLENVVNSESIGPQFYILEKLNVRISNSFFGTSTSEFRTSITFDNGATWESLKLKDLECNDCQVNLFGTTSDLTGGGVRGAYNFRIKAASSPYLGTIIANGNIGPYFSESNYATSNLYISTDAGKSWSLLFPGTWLFDIEEGSGTIAMGNYLGQTNTILYSHDGGVTFNQCRFHDETILHNIQFVSSTYGDSKSSFWVQTQYNYPNSVATMYSLFFVNLSQPNPSERECNASDYETVTMPKCSLGKKLTITRKKSGSHCNHDLTILQNSSVELCECTRSDYFCTRCFIPDMDNECTLPSPTCSRALSPSSLNCSAGEFYKLPPRYLRASSTACINPVKEYEEISLALCPVIFLGSPPVLVAGNTKPRGDGSGISIESNITTSTLNVPTSTQQQQQKIPQPESSQSPSFPLSSVPANPVPEFLVIVFVAVTGCVIIFLVVVGEVGIRFWERKKRTTEEEKNLSKENHREVAMDENVL